MRAYKGFNRHDDGTLWCRNFQYEVGNVYTFEGEPILCEQGFHACHEPWQCWYFYPNNGENVYYEVECGGKIVESNEEDGKFVCTEITLVKEIPAPENKFDWCGYFIEGRAVVRLYSKYNFIDTEGKYLFGQWWDYCYSFHGEYAIVALNGKRNYINTEGKYLSEQWFDDVYQFNNGYAIVEVNGKHNLINTEGKLLSEQWFDWCGDFCNGYALVNLDSRWNFINTDGKYLSEQWWEDVYGFYNGRAGVRLNDKWYEIDKTGKIIEK